MRTECPCRGIFWEDTPNDGTRCVKCGRTFKVWKNGGTGLPPGDDDVSYQMSPRDMFQDRAEMAEQQAISLDMQLTEVKAENLALAERIKRLEIAVKRNQEKALEYVDKSYEAGVGDTVKRDAELIRAACEKAWDEGWDADFVIEDGQEEKPPNPYTVAPAPIQGEGAK